MTIDFSKISESKRYKLMSNTIFPRPIAWITTEDEEVLNLAPFSYFAPISLNPPCVVVSIGHKKAGEMKDTLLNILKHKVCTINFAHKEQLEMLKLSANELPKEISECEKYGIETKDIIENFPPMVELSHCALFCEFIQKIDIQGEITPLILEIKHIYIDDKNIDEKGYIHLENVARVGSEFLIDSLRVK
jgi:flavin reductase (DIM6/NTAB) family NADH-FMN oxidoreductase RutF